MGGKVPNCNPTDVHLHWSPAQHNISHMSDRQNETAVILNMVVDAAAKHSATAVGKDETVGESPRP